MNPSILRSHLGSISPTFYAQLLHAQIPKVQKDIEILTEFLCFLDLSTLKLRIKCWWNWSVVGVKIAATLNIHVESTFPFSSNKNIMNEKNIEMNISFQIIGIH